jgi:ArsR family transcriptional regulator
MNEPPISCCVPLAHPTLSDEDAAATASVFRALADPARVRIVNLLAAAEGPVCVCEITQSLGLSQPTVSHHLKKLLDTGLVEREQRGTWSFYSLDREGLARVASLIPLEVEA